MTSFEIGLPKDCINNLYVDYREIILKISEIIKLYDSKLEVYLFGSYAKCRVGKYSDIDLLLLTEEEIDKRESFEYKIDIEEFIFNKLNDILDLDIKFYNKDNFIAKSKCIGFENEISKYMIRI